MRESYRAVDHSPVNPVDRSPVVRRSAVSRDLIGDPEAWIIATVLITGANRGIGLEHVRQSLAAGDSVIACCRQPVAAAELRELRVLHGARALELEALDLAAGASAAGLAARLAKRPIDLLINNGGMYGTAAWPEGARLQSLAGMDYELWEQVLRVNLMGTFRVTAELMPNVLAGAAKKVVMISSDLGSITNCIGYSHAYRSSKAALNMVARGLSVELRAQGVTVIALAPGWTKTDLGGPGAEWSVEDSVAAQRRVIAALSLADSGRFINLTGEDLPW